MTDGPTGIQVAPTEGEMTQAQDVLRRAISAIVGMSQLQSEVDALRSDVATLRADSDRLRSTNASLDEALFQSRTARQGLETELAEAKRGRDQLQADYDQSKLANDSLHRAVEGLKDRLQVAEQGRDQAELRVMELEDETKALQAKLDAVREGFKSIFGGEVDPKTELMPAQTSQPVPITESRDEGHAEPVQVSGPTIGQPWGLPATSDEWRPGYSWDNDRQLYVKDPDPNHF